MIETISFLPCLPVALIYQESLAPFLWSSVVTGFCWLVFRFSGRNANTDKISSRDTFLIVTLAWVLFSIFGSLPYLISKTIPSFINAFFESASGFTTTGASILKEVENLPYSILFYRSLTHWIGGIGIIVLVILILPSLKVTGYQLFSLESSMKEKIHPKAKGIAYRIMFIYTGLTLIETGLLVSGDMSLFDSVCHAFGTIATGGFSTKNTSLMYFSTYSQYIVMIFMFLAGISQVVYYYLVKFNFRKVKHNEELWFYLGTVVSAGTIVLTVCGSDTITSASTVVACIAGIGPGLGSAGPMSNYSGLPEISKIVLSILMIVGRLEIVTVFVLFGRSFWKL